MIKIFETLEKYNTYTNNGQNLESGDLYYVKEDNSTHYLTNNIDGVTTIYDTVENPTGNIEITENGEDIDIAQYATATVDVPIPEGYIIPSGNKSITANGENIDVNDYATATVNVPVPPEYIIPTGNKEITQNGTGIDVAQYATATVNVAASSDDYGHVVYATFYVTSNNTPINVTFNPEAFTKIELNGQAIQLNGKQYNFGPKGTYTLKYTLASTTTIPQKTFGWCYNLTNISNIPSSITSIGGTAFYGCKFTDFIIPYGVTSIGESAFNTCTGLTSIHIPNSVTSIGNSAFSAINSLRSVIIGSGVTSIGSNAFDNCNYIKSIIIMATTPPTLGSNAFPANGTCPIYVPAASVDAYKAASRWSEYASRIQAL